MDNSFDSPSNNKQNASNGVDLTSKLVTVRRLSILRRIEELLRMLSPAERLVLYGLSMLLAASTLALLYGASSSVSVRIPSAGGSLVEGEIGPARFINPVLAVSSADQDLTALVFSGLTRAKPDGTIIPDIAASYEISTDGTTYTFRIRPDAVFQDGTPVTSSDILYTVRQAQSPTIKSPHRADWEGVTVSTPDIRTVVFKLPRAYAPFIQNTTLGILPRHVWADTTAEDFPFNPLNTHPIGSGPYKIYSVDTDSTGAATRYTLVPFKSFRLGGPYLRSISFVMYPNEDAIVRAFNQRQIDAIAGLSPDQLSALKRTDAQVLREPLPRVFGVFFNQGHAAVLADLSVRQALDKAIDKDRLVKRVLHGYGVPLNSPIPPGMLTGGSAPATASSTVSTAYTQESIAAARQILQKGGWTYDQSGNTWSKNGQQLTFSLATADAGELTATADAIATAWRQAGIKVNVQVYPLSELNSTIIRPRSYDAILFGEVVGRELDLFAFWHSSQRNDPGLNLALYANSKADTLLSQARATTQTTERDKLYSQFADLIQKDQPAVFLYAPEFLYVVPKGVHGVALGALTTPSERFLNVYTWYTDTERVWTIFANDAQAVN